MPSRSLTFAAFALVALMYCAGCESSGALAQRKMDNYAHWHSSLGGDRVTTDAGYIAALDEYFRNVEPWIAHPDVKESTISLAGESVQRNRGLVATNLGGMKRALEVELDFMLDQYASSSDPRRYLELINRRDLAFVQGALKWSMTAGDAARSLTVLNYLMSYEQVDLIMETGAEAKARGSRLPQISHSIAEFCNSREFPLATQPVADIINASLQAAENPKTAALKMIGAIQALTKSRRSKEVAVGAEAMVSRFFRVHAVRLFWRPHGVDYFRGYAELVFDAGTESRAQDLVTLYRWIETDEVEIKSPGLDYKLSGHFFPRFFLFAGAQDAYDLLSTRKKEQYAPRSAHPDVDWR